MQSLFSKIDTGSAHLNAHLTKPQIFALLSLLTLPIVFPQTVLIVGFGLILFALLGLLLAKTVFQTSLSSLNLRYVSQMEQYQRIASFGSNVIVNTLCIVSVVLAIFNPVTTIAILARVIGAIAVFLSLKKLLVRSHLSSNKIYPHIPFTPLQCVDSRSSIFTSLATIAIGASLLIFNPIAVLASIVQAIGIIALIKAFSLLK